MLQLADKLLRSAHRSDGMRTGWAYANRKQLKDTNRHRGIYSMNEKQLRSIVDSTARHAVLKRPVFAWLRIILGVGG
jgi:hypothetical protein